MKFLQHFAKRTFSRSDLSSSNVNDRDADGLTKLHFAVAKGDLAEIKRLLAVGADVNCRTGGKYSGQTALHIASRDGHFDIVRFLLDTAADIDAQTEFGYAMYIYIFCRSFEPKFFQISLTPLHYASMNGQVSAVEFLAFEGADVRKRDRFGCVGILFLVIWFRNRAFIH